MTQLDPCDLLCLPDEVIQTILSYTPPQSVVSVHATCRRLAIIASGPLLWRSFCQAAFTWWDKRHDIESKLRDASFTEWEALYKERHLASQHTRDAFANLMSKEEGKLDAVQCFLDTGYDAKDVLIAASKAAYESDMYLAQRYWSHAALGCLNRYAATQEWAYLKYRDHVENETERSFGGLDLFILGDRETGDINDIIDRLNSYVDSVRTAHPDIDNFTPQQRAITVAQHLLSNGWVGIQDDRHYHSLDHMFVGVAVHSSNRNSVPLISSIIYCYVARQFDLRTSPISYPFHVHSLVQPPPGFDLSGNALPLTHDSTTTSHLTHLYLDPFTTSIPITLTHLESQLRFIAPNTAAAQTAHYLLPSTARDLTIRAAHNILSAPSHYSGPSLFTPLPTNAATYAALFALVLLPTPMSHPAQLRQHLAVLAQHFLEYFDLDVHLFSTYILPLTTTLPDARAYRSLLQNLKDTDSTARVPKRRTGENSQVKFRIGQVFRHQRRGYLAVIYGWDPWCKMQETWISMNQVDRLGRGRGQPFYNVLVEDESTRYVAEENVQLLPRYELKAIGEEELIGRFPIEIGKWFKRWSWDDWDGSGIEEGEKAGGGGGRFVSNMRGEYPED